MFIKILISYLASDTHYLHTISRPVLFYDHYKNEFMIITSNTNTLEQPAAGQAGHLRQTTVSQFGIMEH